MLMFENLINDYLKNNYNSDSDISISKIKADIKTIIGQEPGVEVKRNKFKDISEKVNGKPKEIENLRSITIAYVDDDLFGGKPQVKKVEFYF